MCKNILIADDNARVRLLLRTLVEEQNFTVVAEAVNGRDAVAKAREFHPHLIVMDFAMPMMSGAEATFILKRELPNIRIILFTLHRESVQAIGNHVRADRVLGKPDGVAKLVETMCEVLDVPNEKNSTK